jgi:hypothetical protein
MFSVKNAMYRLVSQGERLEGQSLLSGFQEFQEWKGAVAEFFEAVASEFDRITETPCGIENGIRFLEKTFKND